MPGAMSDAELQYHLEQARNMERLYMRELENRKN